MGVLDSLVGGRKSPKTTGRTVLVLTPLGKAKAEKFDLPGEKWKILSCLNENGPSTVAEISNETGMSESKVREIARNLLATGYVKRAGTSD